MTKQVIEPWAKVVYENVDISADIEGHLLELKYTDHLRGENAADTVTVKLEDSRGLFQGPLYPVKGAGLYFEFGANNKDKFSSGKGYRIDGITVNVNGLGAQAGGPGPGGTVEWVASGQQPSAALHTRKSLAWTDTTLEGIAKAISAEHGMELVYECNDNIKLLRIDQFNETDLALIKRLAKEYGLACSIKGGKEKPTLVIADLDIAKSRPPAFKIYRRDCTSAKFEDKAGLNTKGRYTRWFDPVKKELVEHEFDRPASMVKDGLTGSSIESLEGRGQQDRAIVREAMEFHVKRVPSEPKASGCTATIGLPGNVSLLSGVTVELPEEDWLKSGGIWVINESTHTLNASAGYTVSLTLERG